MRQFKMLVYCTVAAVGWSCGLLTNGQADEVDLAIARVAKAGPQGAGSADAKDAAEFLAQQGVDVIPRLLEAMDTPNIVAANWYRTAFESVLQRALAADEPQLPIAFLQHYVKDPERQGRPRRLALGLLDRVDPEFQAAVLPTMLEDPVFREDAVAQVLEQGDGAKQAGDAETAKQRYELAFQHARVSSQVTRAADRLRSVGVQANIVEHMGFIARWYVIGPFDAPGRSGFDTRFPPEEKVDLSAGYVGQDAVPIRWQQVASSDRLGQLNLVQTVAAVKEAVGYAYCEIEAPARQTVQLRCGADDNLTVWLNDEQILAKRQWLNGTRLDRFTAPAVLQAGKNTVLVKVCQGPQHKNPAVPNNWSLQLRFCDASGRAAKFRVIVPEEAKANVQDQ